MKYIQFDYFSLIYFTENILIQYNPKASNISKDQRKDSKEDNEKLLDETKSNNSGDDDDETKSHNSEVDETFHFENQESRLKIESKDPIDKTTKRQYVFFSLVPMYFCFLVAIFVPNVIRTLFISYFNPFFYTFWGFYF